MTNPFSKMSLRRRFALAIRIVNLLLCLSLLAFALR